MVRNTLSNLVGLAKTRCIRLTDADYAKFLAIGGAIWLRKKIKAAPQPKEDQPCHQSDK